MLHNKLIFAVLVLFVAGCLTTPDQTIRINVVSSPPELVSGSDARLEIHIPDGMSDEDLSIKVGDRDVSSAFALQPEKGIYEGVVQQLPIGESTVTVSMGESDASIQLTNHAITGPMFSGPVQDPFLCASEKHRSNARLGDVLDTDCSMDTQVSFVYKSTETDQFEEFDPAGARPNDLATTTTMDGAEVDFIVRWERGTINRFIYSISMLSPAAFDPDTPDLSSWNGRLIYYFQGGVGIGHYQGDPNRQRMLYEHGLSKGYAIAYSTGTRTSTHYDLEVGGETAIMVKDRFVSAYGNPAYTVGVGGSGGGIQQYVYGQNHPGLIDAAIPQYSYPDMVTQGIHIGDCELLERYMDAEVARNPNSKWATWSNRTLLQGMNASDTLPNRYTGGRPGLTECINGWRGLTALTFNPYYGTAPGVTAEQQANTHWTHYEDAVQIYGRNEEGFARRTWDNVGVQYGLTALHDGHISPEEFLDLNARIGGWKATKDIVQEGQPYLPEGEGFDVYSARNMHLSPDDSGEEPAPRTRADQTAIDAAYEHGLVFTGQLEIPIIDWRHYLEDELDMHNSHQSFAARQRLLNHDNDASNQVVWFTDVDEGTPRFDQTPMAFDVIDEWMRNIEANPQASVAENKPDRAIDSCFDTAGNLIHAGNDAWDGILDDSPKGACASQFKLYSTSRIVAGGPITGDVFKCTLQTVDAAIDKGLYGSWEISANERDRLKEIFPDGVCDYGAVR